MSNQHTIRSAVETMEGAGVTVKRLMPVPDFMNFDPFVLCDHFLIGPGTGFPDHPHRGFEAITYMFEGSMNHKDNLGNESTVTVGGAQRFTAGSGLVHSEMPGATGNSTGIQLWINLPGRLKQTPPAYQQVDSGDIPEHAIENGKLRVIVGEDSPLELLTPVRYLDITLDEGGHYAEDISSGYRGFIYVVSGQAILNQQQAEAGDACFYESEMDAESRFEIKTNRVSRLMVCLGRPHHEPIRQHGSYVD